MRQGAIVIATLVTAVSLAGTARSGTIAVLPLAPTEREIEVLAWSQGDRAPVLARSDLRSRDLGSALTLAPGDYALRLSGTDYRHGPVRLGDLDHHAIRLGSIAVVAPVSAPTVFFALDRATGNVAARIPADGRSVPILPGTFDLVRDLSDVSTPIEVAPGQHLAVACGALALDVPSDAADFELWVTTAPGDRIAAHARFAAGPVALLPGTYRVLRDRSGVFSEPIAVEAGAVHRLRCGALRVLPLGPIERGYAVFTKDQIPALEARAAARAQVVFPGEYRIASRESVAAARQAHDARSLERAPAFVAAPGRITTSWVAPDGSFVSRDAGEVPVRIATTVGSDAALGRPLAITVELAEPCAVSLRAEAVSDESTLASSAVDRALPPSVEIPLTLPETIADSTPFTVAVEVKPASGAILHGRSEPALAVKARASALGEVTALAKSATTIELTWPAASGAVGYRVYRDRAGAPPIHGERLLDGPRFLDVGLGAERSYSYSLCGVDERGVEGPRVVVRAVTLASGRP